jgi:hypothetical protein
MSDSINLKDFLIIDLSPGYFYGGMSSMIPSLLRLVSLGMAMMVPCVCVKGFRSMPHPEEIFLILLLYLKSKRIIRRGDTGSN